MPSAYDELGSLGNEPDRRAYPRAANAPTA
jgi:hypothetical protein